MSTLEVRARTALEIVSTNLSDLIALADQDAAPALNTRMGALDIIHKVHERSYAERAIIVREFERRKLWEFLVDPDTGTPFASLTAWMSCSDFLGCRRVNFEAKRDMEMLKDVPSAALLGVPKSNIKVLKQLSTKVRNEPAVLEAARDLTQDKFLAKLEVDKPDQHIEVRKPLRFAPGRAGAKAVEETIKYALEHDIAGTRDEALVRMAETALNEWQLEQELKDMPAEDETPSVSDYGGVRLG